MIALSQSLQYVVGGAVQETADHSLEATVDINWLQNSVSAQLCYGALPAGTFLPSVRATSVWLTLDMTSGQWNASSGQTGTLTPAQLTQFVNTMKAARNMIEQFAVTSGVIPGTQTPW